MSSFSNNTNGFLLVDKPKGYTSRDVVNVVSNILHTKKIGHTGTLDPLATGLLILCIGKYTNLSELITSYDKEYIAKVMLGTSTDTYDITGNVIKENKVDNITKEIITNCLNHFVGIQHQQVPIYSAVKVNGKKLYEYARNNQKVELPSKEINVKEISLLDNIVYENNKIIFTIKCHVSKGTYIRSLINDIGNYLNTGATMLELRRTKQGLFNIDNSVTLDNIKNNNYHLLSIREMLPDLKIIKVDDEIKEKVINGNIIENIFDYDMCLIEDNKHNELAIYQRYDNDNDKLKPYKML